MVNKNIKHIFFDLDHTLWDFDKNSEFTFKKIFTINSIDIDAPESAMNEIAMMTLELIGIKIRDAELLQAATSMENKGI
jgi:FMN phosphatase YigB (HAD superfamily)